jgi:hypothetical protein
MQCHAVFGRLPLYKWSMLVGREKNLETSLALIGRQLTVKGGDEESRNLDNRHQWNSTKDLSFIMSRFVIENTRAGQPQV